MSATLPGPQKFTGNELAGFMPATMDAEGLVTLSNIDGIFNETGRGTQAGQDKPQQPAGHWRTASGKGGINAKEHKI